MKPIRNAFLVVCLAAALGATTASAATEPATPNTAPTWHGGHGGPGGPDGGFRHVLDQLGLTAEQKTQIHSIFDQAKPQLQATHQGGRANREQLAVTPPTDPGYAGLIAFAKSNAVEQIQLMSDLWTQVYARLTPDQRARIPGIVATERAERDARMASWRQQRSGQ
jgi:Spy/CpxP family protein refolding chaperone